MRLHENSAASVSVELDQTNYAEFCRRALDYEAAQETQPGPRSYPGYPSVRLPKAASMIWRSLSASLKARRSVRELESVPLSRRELSTVLFWAHGAMRPQGAGPVPSSGGLQALELYLVCLEDSWLSPGVYHYDRSHHLLSLIAKNHNRTHWRCLIPSLDHVQGGNLIWILAGDGARIEEKYGSRSAKLLCLEAGHLMQNLCLISTAIGASTIPLGGFFEGRIARELGLQPGDMVLYAGVTGKIA